MYMFIMCVCAVHTQLPAKGCNPSRCRVCVDTSACVVCVRFSWAPEHDMTHINTYRTPVQTQIHTHTYTQTQTHLTCIRKCLGNLSAHLPPQVRWCSLIECTAAHAEHVRFNCTAAHRLSQLPAKTCTLVMRPHVCVRVCAVLYAGVYHCCGNNCTFYVMRSAEVVACK